MKKMYKSRNEENLLPFHIIKAASEGDVSAINAVLLGAVGGYKWDNTTAKVRPEQALLGLREGLNLYCKIRFI